VFSACFQASGVALVEVAYVFVYACVNTYLVEELAIPLCLYPVLVVEVLLGIRTSVLVGIGEYCGDHQIAQQHYELEREDCKIQQRGSKEVLIPLLQ